MNVQEVVKLVSNLIEQHRVDIGERPNITPVTWKGISMTVEEAKLVIQGLEAAKLKYQSAMNNTQVGGEITILATGGTGLVAMVTGVALMLFPLTAIAGAATLVGGIGLAGVGKAVGDGVREIGTNSNVQALQQIEAYIDSIKNAIIASI
jgi:hypothetical protein